MNLQQEVHELPSRFYSSLKMHRLEPRVLQLIEKLPEDERIIGGASQALFAYGALFKFGLSDEGDRTHMIIGFSLVDGPLGEAIPIEKRPTYTRLNELVRFDDAHIKRDIFRNPDKLTQALHYISPGVITGYDKKGIEKLPEGQRADARATIEKLTNQAIPSEVLISYFLKKKTADSSERANALWTVGMMPLLRLT